MAPTLVLHVPRCKKSNIDPSYALHIITAQLFNVDHLTYSGFTFETSDKGAVLIVPKGAISEDLLNRKILDKYAIDDCGRTVNNRDIRLVIGLDKVPCRAIATFERTVNQQILLEFKGINGENTGTTYTWNCVGNGKGRSGPLKEEISDLRSEIDTPPILRNQCVFMRTLNSSLSGEVWRESFVHRVRSGKGGSLGPAPSNYPLNGGTSGVSQVQRM